MFQEKDIIDYYDITESQYRLNWKLNECMALHYGYVDDQNRNFKKSLMNMNKILMEKADINQESQVLDAGCGVGGTAIYIAQHTGAFTTGITIVEKQVEQAKKNAKKCGVEKKTNFEVQNYLNTSFEDQTFDVIIAVESSCHAPTIADFTTEAFRLLKPGGRLVFSDYIKKTNLSDDENNLIKKWINGWAIDDIPTNDEVEDALSVFSSFSTENATSHIMNSSKYMYQRYLLSFIPQRIYEFFFNAAEASEGNFNAAKLQYIALKRNLWNYQIYTALK